MSDDKALTRRALPAKLVDPTMKMTVEISDALEIARRLAERLVILILSELTQLDDSSRSHATRSARRAVGLEKSAQLEEIVAILARPFRDDRSLMRNELEQAFCMQISQRLPYSASDSHRRLMQLPAR